MTSAIHVSVGVLTQGQRVLIGQRGPQDPHPLKWEFPGGKALANEDVGTCLHRELREELGIDATIGAVLHYTTHTYANGRIVALTFLHVPAYVGEIENKQFQSLAWVTPLHLLQYDFLEGDIAFVTALARGRWAYIFA
jgi:mutator protein MutT